MFGYTHIDSAFELYLKMKYFINLSISLIRLQGKSSIIQDELVRLGEKMVTTSEGTRAIALELCREFEDKFLQHINTGEVSFLIIYFKLYHSILFATRNVNLSCTMFAVFTC